MPIGNRPPRIERKDSRMGYSDLKDHAYHGDPHGVVDRHAKQATRETNNFLSNCNKGRPAACSEADHKGLIKQAEAILKVLLLATKFRLCLSVESRSKLEEVAWSFVKRIKEGKEKARKAREEEEEEMEEARKLIEEYSREPAAKHATDANTRAQDIQLAGEDASDKGSDSNVLEEVNHGSVGVGEERKERGEQTDSERGEGDVSVGEGGETQPPVERAGGEGEDHDDQVLQCSPVEENPPKSLAPKPNTKRKARGDKGVEARPRKRAMVDAENPDGTREGTSSGSDSVAHRMNALLADSVHLNTVIIADPNGPDFDKLRHGTGGSNRSGKEN